MIATCALANESASTHPLARVDPQLHPRAQAAHIAAGPAHLDIAEHSLGVRHHCREATKNQSTENFRLQQSADLLAKLEFQMFDVIVASGVMPQRLQFLFKCA